MVIEKNEKLPEFADNFLHQLELKGRQPSTIKRYHYDLADFFQWLAKEKGNWEKNTWLSLQQNDFEDFFNMIKMERRYSIATIKRIYTVLKRLWNDEGTENMNPFPSIDMISKSGDRKLTKEDFFSVKEVLALRDIIFSDAGLTENQQRFRHLLVDRNATIIMLLMDYGLTLKELVSIEMKDLSFGANTIYVSSNTSISRTLTISNQTKKQIHQYLTTIPSPVRPSYHSNDSLLIAFDYQRGTFRWNYDNEQPKTLSEMAVQKMIREEIKRAGLRKGLCAQQMRNTCILKKIHTKANTIDELKSWFGFKTVLSLKRYIEFYENEAKTFDFFHTPQQN